MTTIPQETRALVAAELKALLAEKEQLIELLRAIGRGYRGSDKDNMEFTYVVPYSVNDRLQAAIAPVIVQRRLP